MQHDHLDHLLYNNSMVHAVVTTLPIKDGNLHKGMRSSLKVTFHAQKLKARNQFVGIQGAQRFRTRFQIPEETYQHDQTWLTMGTTETVSHHENQWHAKHDHLLYNIDIHAHPCKMLLYPACQSKMASYTMGMRFSLEVKKRCSSIPNL